MDHEHDGIADDSRPGQQRGLEPHVQGIEEAHEQSGGEASDGNRADELAKSREEEIEERIAIGAIKSWSGIIPSPEDFSSYPAEVQAKTIEWTDANILDESRRQDRILAIYSRNSLMAQIVTLVVNLAIVVGCLVAFWATGNPNVFWAFTIPGASIIGNVVVSVKGKKDDGELK